MWLSGNGQCFFGRGFFWGSQGLMLAWRSSYVKIVGQGSSRELLLARFPCLAKTVRSKPFAG